MKKIPMILTGMAAGMAAAADFERELSADRPDTTESPYTVEPGRWQVESDLWSMTRDREGGVERRSWALFETNVKLGLTENQDLQWVVRPWVREETRRGGVDSVEGLGDMEIRWKWNVAGNDGEGVAWGVMPYVSVPTGSPVSAGGWQGGVIVMATGDLGKGWGWGGQVQLDRVRDEGREDWEWLHSVVVGRDLPWGFGGYLEWIGVAGRGEYEGSVSGGVTRAVGESMQWDAGVVIGVTDAADDLTLFQGLTWRF